MIATSVISITLLRQFTPKLSKTFINFECLTPYNLIKILLHRSFKFCLQKSNLEVNIQTQ